MVQQAFLDNEEAVIKRLKTVYNKSLEDITDKASKLQKEFEELESIYDNIEDEEEKKVLKSRMRSKVYQKQYQESLKKQVSGIIDKLHDEDYKTVSEYLEKCYDDGFIGTMYDLQGQGIPMCFPLDQESMVRAVQLDSKISEGLYNHLGENYSLLKKRITAEVSRGIASSMTYGQVAQQLAAKMTGIYKNPGGALAYSMRIARTEGHRIQCQATMDACYNAKDRGANIVKQWDATLDGRTRDSHSAVDGEWKELDEKFSNGLMFPGDPSGRAEEVIHCRCALLQKSRDSLKNGFTKMNNFTKQLETFESPEDYAEFKKAFFSKENKAYMNHVQSMEEKYKTKDFAKVLDKMDTREYNRYSKLVEQNPVFNKKALTNAGKSVKMPSGALYGAYNDDNDPLHEKRDAHAVRYYAELRNSSPLYFAKAVSKNADIDEVTVSKAYTHLFVDDHGFIEDYDMAESLRRLRTNDHIQEHDRLLIFHEALEHDIMEKNPGMPYTEAHDLTDLTYNYAVKLNEWKRKGGK